MTKKILSIVAILAVAVGVYYLFFKDNKQTFIDYKEPTLTAEEKTQAEQKLKEAQDRVSNLPHDASNEERYNALTFLGNQYYLLGRLKEARDIYLQTTEVEPDNYSGWANLAAVETDMGDLRSAHKHLIKATEKTFRPDPWKWLIDFEKERLGASPARLEELYLESIEKTKGFGPDMLKHYAIFLEQEKGDLRGALTYWKKAQEQLPNSESIKAEIERLESLIQ